MRINLLSMKAEMKSYSSGGTSVLKQHYEKKVHELEQEKRAMQVSVLWFIFEFD